MHRALRFLGVSGVGWIFDLTVTALLVGAGMRVMLAGVIGGLAGATFAFLSSSRVVFPAHAGPTTLNVVSYVVYSLVLILAAGSVMEWVANGLLVLLRWGDLTLALPLIAIVAKCIVTPLTLAANFLVARALLTSAPFSR